jgi:branched-chain amino acid transport system ATP-binding protein
LAASLTITGLEAGYGAVRILHGVSLRVGAGETVALLGTNGNGKSTLMKAIMGMVRPGAGSIIAEIDGASHELVGMATEAIVDLGITVVPEGRRLFPRLSVTENLLMGAYRKAARAKLQQNLDFCFEVFPRLAERRNQLAGSMSGGEQQMLALARALMSAPRLLLVDEPSVGLAPLLVTRTIDKIRELKAEQNFTEAIRIADRGYVIVHGSIEFEAQSRADLDNNALIRSLYLGE